MLDYTVIIVYELPQPMKYSNTRSLSLTLIYRTFPAHLDHGTPSCSALVTNCVYLHVMCCHVTSHVRCSANQRPGITCSERVTWAGTRVWR